MALSSGQGALEQDILKLAQAQNQQTQLLGQQLRSMASAQAQAAQAQQQQSTMLEHLLANLAETQAQSSQLLVVTMRGLQRSVERFSQDGANLKTEPCCKKTGPLKQPQAEQFVICSEAAASENDEFSDGS
jgi:DNA anti-recombination protein RmuC